MPPAPRKVSHAEVYTQGRLRGRSICLAAMNRVKERTLVNACARERCKPTSNQTKKQHRPKSLRRKRQCHSFLTPFPSQLFFLFSFSPSLRPPITLTIHQAYSGTKQFSHKDIAQRLQSAPPDEPSGLRRTRCNTDSCTGRRGHSKDSVSLPS